MIRSIDHEVVVLQYLSCTYKSMWHYLRNYVIGMSFKTVWFIKESTV